MRNGKKTKGKGKAGCGKAPCKQGANTPIQPKTRFVATDPNFYRKESGKMNVPSLKQSTAMVNRADAVYQLLMTIPQDRFGSFNIEIARLYQSIRRNNSANAAYTMADLACYILNVRGVRCALTQITRTVRAARAVDPFDTGIPYIVIGESAGVFNSATIVPELLGSAAQIKDALSKLNRLVETSLPVGDFTAFRLDDWLLSSMFKDTDGPKYSHIMASPQDAKMWTYTIDSNGNVVSGTPINLGTGSTPMFDFITAIAAWVTELTTSYTNALIAGDIQHAMGNLSYHPIAGALEIDTPIEPVYDRKALRIFKNATVLYSTSGANQITSSLNVTTGVVSNAITLNGTYNNVANHSPAVDAEYYISAEPDATSIGDIALGTYLMCHGELSSNTFTWTNTSGWSIMDIHTMYCDNSVSTTLLSKRFAIYINAASSAVQSTAMEGLQNVMGLWSMVDWMPILFMQYATDYQYMWDIDYFARITAENLDTYQSILITSMYDTAANAIR